MLQIGSSDHHFRHTHVFGAFDDSIEIRRVVIFPMIVALILPIGQIDTNLEVQLISMLQRLAMSESLTSTYRNEDDASFDIFQLPAKEAAPHRKDV